MKLHSLPLFPLDTVLYPGAKLSLQVFEVRYLDMIGKCYKTGAPFGVVLLTEGSEVRAPGTGAAGAPPFAAQAFSHVGTLARLVDLFSPQPGLLRIRCKGMQRFQIERHETLKHGLWVADVTLLPADQQISIPPDLRGTAMALQTLMQRLQARHAANDEDTIPIQPPYQWDDCAWVSNRWCELLPIPMDLKQRMLELDNPLLRLELVNDILERTGIAS